MLIRALHCLRCLRKTDRGPAIARVSFASVILLLFVAPQFVFGQGSLTNVTATPSNAAAGAGTIYTINFTNSLAGAIPTDGKIRLTFPPGFDVANVSLAQNISGLNGGYVTVTPVGQIVTLARDGFGAPLPASTPASLRIAVVNNTTLAAGYRIFVETLTNAEAPIDTATSALFNIAPGQVQRFAFDAVSTVTAGVPFNLVIRAKDIYDNTVTSFTGTLSLFDITNTLNPPTAVIASNGTVTVSNATITKAQSSVLITAVSGSLGSLNGTSNAFNVVHGPLDHFAVTNTSGGIIGSQVAGAQFSIRLVAQDVYKNTVTAFTGNVTFSNTTGSITPPASGNFSSGVLASQAVTINKVASADSITVSGGAPIKTGSSNGFFVGSGNLAGFQIDPVPSPQTAGVPIPVKVIALDLNGNTATDFTGTVNFSLTGGLLTPAASGNFVAGVWNGNLTVLTSGTGKIINVTDGTFNISSNAFDVNPGGAASFAVTNASDGNIGAQIAGTNFSLKITARDANGNVATGFTGAVGLTDNTGTLTPGAATITTGGTATVNVNVTRAQASVSIAAKSGSLTGASNIFSVSHAALDHFLVTNTSDGSIGTQRAGTPFNIKIVAKDFFNNTVTAFSGAVALANVTASIAPVSSGNFSSGVLASQSVTITKTSTADSITVSGGVPFKTGNSNSFVVSAGNLAGFVLSNIPSPQTAGVPFPLTVTAVDANQNTVASFAGTVNISINSGNVIPGSSSNFVSGVWNGNVTVSASGNGKIITVSNGAFSTPSNAFNVNAGALDHFEIAAIGPQTAGVSFTVAVTAKDVNNNNVSHTGIVTLSDITGTLTASPLVFSGQVTQSATDVQIKKAQSGVVITASGNGKIGLSAPFVVNPAALDHFLVTNTSGGNIISPQTAGVAFNIRMVAQDQFDNTVTGFAQTVTISDLGTLNLTSANFVAGVLASQSVTINQARNDDQLTVTGGAPARSGASNLFNVIAGGVASFAIDPVSDQATNETFIITIRALDGNGNLATSFGGTVTIGDLTNTITPTASLQFINGVRNESVKISQIRTGDVITVSSGGASGNSNPFNVTAVTVDHFAINTIGNQTAGQPFAVTITAQDASNNTVTSFTGTVTVSDLSNSISPVTSNPFSGGVLTQNFAIAKSFTNDQITVTGQGKSNTSNQFNVAAGDLHHFAIANIPNQTAGVSFPITITAQDVNNNTVTSFGGTVTIAINPGSITPTVSGTFANGVRIESVTVPVVGNNRVISVNDGNGHTGPSNAFNVTAGGLDHFVFNTIATQTAGAPFSFTITAKDANNNDVSFNGPITLTDNTSTLIPASVMMNGVSVTVNNAQITKAQTGVVITATGGGKTGASLPFTVNPGTLSRVRIVQGNSGPGTEFPTHTMSADDQLSLHAAGYDTHGNYINDPPVNWVVTPAATPPFGVVAPATSSSFTNFSANRVTTTARIIADHANASVVDDTTGNITITAGQPNSVRVLQNAFGPTAPLGDVSMSTGETRVVHASSYDADGNRIQDVSVTWKVTGGIGFVNPSAGVSTTFTATTAGNTGTIIADHSTYNDGFSGTITVNASTLSYIRIIEGSGPGGTPEVGNLTISADRTLQVHAAGFDANGNYLGDQIVTWSISAPIGTLSASSGTTTIFDPKTPGTGFITATYSNPTVGSDNTGTITVTAGPDHHIKILKGLSGATAEATSDSLFTGETRDFHASSFDIDDNRKADVSVTWSVSGGIGSLNPPSGSGTTLTASTVGSGVITAQHATLGSDQTGVIKVKAGNLSYVRVVEGPVGDGQKLGATSRTTDQVVTVHAAGYDANNNYLGDQPVTWSVIGANIGTFDISNGPSTTLTLRAPGVGRIVADHVSANDDTSGAITVSVGALHHVKVLTADQNETAVVADHSLNADETFLVHAGGYDADDNYRGDEPVNWTVTGGIGTLTPASGISTTLNARKVGNGQIKADHANPAVGDGLTGTITVTPGALAFIKVIEGATGPDTPNEELGAKTITADDVLQLHAAGFDADSNNVGDQPVNWSSAGNLTPVVTGTNVTSIAFAPTLSPASGTIRATHASAGFDDTGIITVNDGELRKIKILADASGEKTEVGATTVASGQTLEVHAAGFDADDNYISDMSANWSVVGAIGGVAPLSGISTTFTAGASGTGSIRATAAGNLEDTAGPITVIPGGVAKIILRTAPNGGGTPFNNLNLTADQEATVYAAGYDVGNTFLGDVNVTWTSTGNLTPAVSATGSSVTFAPTLANADGSVNGLIIGEYSPSIKDSTGTITVLPGNPSGTISLVAAPSGLPSNGTSTSTITTSAAIKDADGNNVGAGKRFTVTLAPGNLGTITTADLDPGTPDVQIATDASSQLSFVFQAGTTGGIVNVNVVSLSGATGSVPISLGSISIASVTTTPTTVSRGQTGVSVSMLVQNVSSVALTEVTAGLIFTGSVDRTGEYAVTPSPSNPTTLAGNSTATFSFIVNVGANAALETITLNGTVSGKVNGTPVSASNANQTDTWTVQLPAVLRVTSVTTAPDTVAQGQTGIEVRVRVANNLGQPNSAAATVDSVRLIFKQGALIETSDYIISSPTGPNSIAGNEEVEYTFLVNVGSAATQGLITIDARVHGKEGNTGALLADTNADTPDSWRVIEGNVFSIISIAASQNTVTANMTNPWQVRMELNNAGSSPIQLNLAPDKTFIRFTIGSQNVTSQYGIASPTELDEGGTVLTAGNNGYLTFDIAPTGSTTGIATISGFAEGRDQAGQTVTDNTNDFGTGAVTVQLPGTMKIDRIDVSQPTVTANRANDWIITATVTNEGESAVRLDSMNVTVGNNIGYIFAKPSTFKDGTNILGTRETKLLDIVVDQTGSQTGTLPINVDLRGTEVSTDRLVASTGVAGSINVQSPAVLEITSVAPSRATVTTNQTAAWNVTVAVRNNGGSQAVVKSDSSTNLRFRLGTQFQNDYDVTLQSAPTIGAGQTAILVFQVTTTGATPGTAALWVKVAATETNSGAEVIDTDNSGSVLVQSPPNVNYIANSMQPDIVNIGTSYAFKVRVHNTAGASTVMLDPANTRFRFSGGPANFVATLDANFVQNLPAGDTTLTFVSTQIPANMPINTYRPVIELRGTENGNSFSQDLTVTNDLRVTARAQVQIVSVQPSQTTVTAGMTQPWNVIVRVANNGGFQVRLDSVGLQLVNVIDRKSEYDITYPTQFLGNGQFLPAGATDSLRFDFNRTGTTTGSTSLTVLLYVTDQSNNQQITPPPLGNSSFNVQSPAEVKITGITTSQPTVTANRTRDWTITATVTNEGGSAIRLHPVLDSLKVTVDNNLGYIYVKPTTFTDGSNLLGGGQTKTLAITVDQTGSQTGILPIRVDLKGFETNSGRLVASTGVSGSINVQSEADLEILSVTPSRPTVTINQTTAWNVTVAVQNNGGSQVAVKNDASSSLRFRIGGQFQNDYTVTQQSAPTIGASGTANVIFQVNTTGANPGTAELWVTVAATETNSDTTLAITDNNSTVLVQTPPSVTYIDGSMQPDIVNIGSSHAFKVRVHNAAGASTVMLDPANTRFRFSGGPANFVANLDANFVQSIPAGDTTLTFVSGQIPANMPINTYRPVIELRGTENGNSFTQDLNVTNDLRVTARAQVQVVSVQPSQTTVTAGMTQPWNVIVRVANNGGFQVRLDSVGLQLVNVIDRKSEYDITYPTQFLGNGQFLPAGATDSLRFDFNRTGTTTGSTSLTVLLYVTDQSNNQQITPPPLGNSSFNVQSPADVKITGITTSQPAVTANRTRDWTITATVTNDGQSTIRLHPALDSLKITVGNNLSYIYVKPTTFTDGSNLLGGGQTKTLAITVDQTGSQTGILPIRVDLKGFETNSDRLVASTGVSGSINVQSPAALQILSVTPSQPTVTTNQATAWNVTVAVQNNGGSQVTVKNDASSSLRFRIGGQFQNGYTVPQQSAPTIGAGGTANVIFQVNTTGANPGTAELWVTVAATETNSDTTLTVTDNNGSVSVQTPPSVTYIDGSMQPNIVNIGTFYTFTVRVNNAGGAATVVLNPATTTFRFSGGSAAFTATLDANPGKVQSIAPGDTTLTFVSTQIPTDMPEGTYTPVVELRGTQNGNPFNTDLSLNELQVTSRAQVAIVSVQPSQSTVTAGMTTPWNIKAAVTNNGGFSVRLDSVKLALFSGTNVTSEYTFSEPSTFVSGNTTLAAGATDTLRIDISITGNRLGNTTAQVRLFVTDESNNLPIIPAPEGTTDFLVQSQAALRIISITPSQPTVTRNQTQQWHIDMRVTNLGQSEVDINFNNSVTGITLSLNTGYTIQQPATFLSGGTRLRGDSTGVLRFLITQTGSQTGQNLINGRIAGIELNSNDPRSDDTNDSGFGSVLVQTPAQLRIDTVRVVGAPNAPFVNLSQPFGVRVVVHNLGEETADSVRVRLVTDGGSQIIPLNGAPAFNIANGLSVAATFNITAASAENLSGEKFQALITGATAHNTGTSITPQAALDDTARVVIQRPASLVIDEVVASRDTVSAGQDADWFVYAVVRNAGAATMTLNTPDRTQLRIEIDGAQQTDYGIEADPFLRQNGNLTLTGGESDTLRFTVTSTGLRGGAASLSVSLAGVDRNDVKPVSAQGTGQIYVRTTATVRLVQTDPIVLRALNGTGFVNVDQVFNVKLTVENTGFENVRDVVVRLLTDGPSRILTPEQTISTITARDRQEISFQVEADTGAVAGAPPEIFTARVVSALTVQGNQPASILVPLDSTAQVVVQQPARLSVAASIQDNNPILSTNQPFTFSALVTNSGQAPVDGSGLVRLIAPGFNVTGSNDLSFTVGQLVTWQVRAPLTPVSAADLRVQITNAAVDSNSQTLAQLGKAIDTLTVQVVSSDLRIVKLEITSPAGAQDRTLSTEQIFDFTARLSYSPDLKNGRAALRFPAGYDSLSATPFGETMTWRLRATATANAIPVYLAVTANGEDGSGNPIPRPSDPPVSDSLGVTTMNKANLNLSTEISDPPGARDGVVARGQEFTVTARVFNDGDAGVDGPARLRVEYDPTQGFSTTEPVEKDVNVGSSVQWKFRAPGSAASDIFTIRYTPTGVPADTNSNARAAQTETLERLSVRTDSVDSELRIVDFRIIDPIGAADNGLSTSQQFTVRAQVLGARAAQVTIKLTEPLGFRTNDNTQQVFSELEEQRDITWTFQAPLASRLDSMVVTVSGNNKNDGQPLPTVRRAFVLSVVEQARLAVSGEISSPSSAAVDGIVTRNQFFTVTARLLNRGAASLSANTPAQLELTLPRDSSIPLADDYSTTSSPRQTITDFVNGAATWEIKARNVASTQVDNIRVTLLQPFPKDENTDSTATVELVQAVIGVQTEPKTLEVQMLPHSSAGPVMVGENSTLLMRLKLTNRGNLNSSNVLLRMFTLHVRDRNNAPLNANSVIKTLQVVDTHRPSQVLGSLTTIPAADSLEIPFVPADTLFGGVPDSVDVVVDIADNNASGAAFRLTFAKTADVDAIDQESREVVDIVFLDERGNSVEAEQITSQKRVINAASFEESFYNYPNPFSPMRDNSDGTRGTKFYYTTSSSANIELRIYNLLGELVYERTFEANDPAGRPKNLSWNGFNGKGDPVLNGVYIAIIKTSAGTAMTKVAVVK